MSSIPAAIDYLVSLGRQTAGEVDGLLVADGWPAALGEFMFGVASDAPPMTTSGEANTGAGSYIALGRSLIDEDYAVPCWIYRHAGGTDQKAVRDQVFAVWNVFLGLLRADLTLGGALANGNNYAGIGDFRLEGPSNEEEAARGRYALLLFSVTCHNRY